MQPIDKSDYFARLYRQYGKDLMAIRPSQREWLRTYSGMMDDVEEEIMYLMVRDMRPDVCAEVSCGSGWSSSWTLNALCDNDNGILFSNDVFDAATKNLCPKLQEYWKFFLGDFRKLTHRYPKQIDFLLIDSDHDHPFCEWLFDTLVPRVRSGGKVLVHDIYQSPNPNHYEANHALEWLEKNGIDNYTPSYAFPEVRQKIDAVRAEIGIVEHIAPDWHPLHDPMLIFDIP